MKLLPKFLRREENIETPQEPYTEIFGKFKSTLLRRDELSSQLQTCPFCSGLAAEIMSSTTMDDKTLYTVCLECERCGMRTKELPLGADYNSLASLVALWNARSSNPKIIEGFFEKSQAENARLRELLARSNVNCIYCGKTSDEIDICLDCERKKDLN